MRPIVWLLLPIITSVFFTVFTSIVCAHNDPSGVMFVSETSTTIDSAFLGPGVGHPKPVGGPQVFWNGDPNTSRRDAHHVLAPLEEG